MGTETFLAVRGVSKTFAPRRWWGPEGGRAATERAEAVLRDVSFDLERGRTLGLVGPSGAGKSTLARCLALFEEPSGGAVLLEGRDLWSLSQRERRAIRAEIQLIVQQPAASLNPRFTVEQAIEEPLRIQRRGTAAARRLAALRWMDTVGLPAAAAGMRTRALSGGESQRVAIARALILEPSLLILDESLSGLDLSVRAQIATLLLDLRRQRSLTYILISHDLALGAQLADEIAVMDAGAIVEQAPAAQLLAAPRHPRSRELVQATRELSLEGPAA